MAIAPTTVFPAVLVLAGLGYLGGAVRSRRYWETPVGPPFVATLVVHGTVALLLGAVALLPSRGVSVENLLYLPLLIPIAWGVFALSYTGWRRLVTPRRVAGVTAFVTAVLLTTFGLSVSGSLGMGDRGLFDLLLLQLSTVTYLLTLAFWTIGIAVVARTTYRSELVGTNQALALVASGAVPFGSVLLASPYYGTNPTFSVGVLATAFGLGALAGTLAVERYDALESIPAAGSVGRSVVVAELNEPMVVVDDRDRVIDLNDAAASTFDVELSSVAGAPVETVLGTTLQRLRSTEDLAIHTTSGRRQFEVSTSTITDEHDRPMGWTVLLRDVTARRGRQQRLTVLNRVLRHNLRNDMNVVQGYAGVVDDYVEEDVPSDYLDRIADTAADLTDLSEEAREVEQLMTESRTTGDPEPLSTVVGRVVDHVADRFPDARVRTDLETDPVLDLNASILGNVLRQLAENAVEHDDDPAPTVEIRSRRRDGGPYPLAVTVADDGPGIPSHEWSVVVGGDETALEHGSGLGLWLVKWGVTRLGGHLELTAADSDGSAVTLLLPEPDDRGEGSVETTTGATGPAGGASTTSPVGEDD